MAGSRLGLVSFGVGLAAAGVGAVVGRAAERVAVGRVLGSGWEPDAADVPFGSVHGDARTVTADDGTRLHVEVDEPERGASQAPTVVLCHGFCLSLDSWHYQRLALRGAHRLVLWDQRGHGRSEGGPRGSASIDQIGRDLATVVAEVAATGPLVLVGHSMGGMTIMSLAAQAPELFERRVVGVALVSTSAGGLETNDYGLEVLGRLVPRVGGPTLRLLSRTPDLVQRGRRLGSDLEKLLVRRYSYASDVSERLVEFTAKMIAETRIDVISDFFPAIGEHDKRAALDPLSGLEVLVLVGDADLLTPPRHSQEIVDRLHHAEQVVVRDGGHLVMLEHPDVVTPHLRALLERAARATAVRRRAARPRGRAG